jgi:hypothetical protein
MPSPKSSPLKKIDTQVKKIEDAITDPLPKVLSRDTNYYFRWALIIITAIVLIVCLILFLTGEDVKKGSETHFGFTSSFLFETAYVVPMLIVGFLLLGVILFYIRNFNVLFVIFYMVFIVLFALSFIFAYCRIPTKKSPTTQVLAIISMAGAVGMLPILFYISDKPLISTFLALPVVFLLGGIIYIGGVYNGEYDV